MINAINTVVRAVRSEIGNFEFIFEMVCGVILVLILSFIIIR